MKRNVLLIIAVISIIIMSFAGCGNKANEVTPADAFADRVKTIIAENSELAGYSMSPLMDQGSGLYAASAIVDGETIGAVSVRFEGDEITEIIISFAASGVAQNKYQQPIIASAMALNTGFVYSDVDKLMQKLDGMLIFGGKPEKINGYTFSCEWRSSDDQIFVKFTK